MILNYQYNILLKIQISTLNTFSKKIILLLPVFRAIPILQLNNRTRAGVFNLYIIFIQISTTYTNI